MDAEELATWIQDRILDGNRQATAGPILTVVEKSEFEMTNGDGTRARVTVEVLS